MSATIDLAGLRMKTGWEGNEQSARKKPMTQAELAERLNIPQSQISKYEKDSSNIPFDLLHRWLTVIGVKLEDAFASSGKDKASSLEPEGINPGEPYKKVSRNCELILEYASSATEEVKNFNEGAYTYQSLRGLVKELKRKPNVVFTGKFDSAKSRSCNAILGSRCLPDRYQPCSRLITIVVHLDDKPTWMQEDVLILNKKFNFNDKFYQYEDSSWDELYRNHLIVAGNLDLLNEYGTHDGKVDLNAKYAIVFLESPILHACNIVDLPGYGSDAEDDVDRAREGAQLADVLIYTSCSTGFLDGEDMERLKYELTRLPNYETGHEGFPPLGNFVILATHASPESKSAEDINDILRIGAKRLAKTLSATWRSVMESRLVDVPEDEELFQALMHDFIRSRMCTFWAESVDRRKDFEELLKTLLSEGLPRVNFQKLNNTVEDYKRLSNSFLSVKLKEYQAIIENITHIEEEYKTLKDNEPARENLVISKKEEILLNICQYRREHLSELDSAYSADINAEALEKMIKKNFSDKKDAQQYLGTYVLDQIQVRLGLFGQLLAKKLTPQIDELLGIYDDALISVNRTNIDTPSLTIPFDSKGAFLGGLASITTIGALALWVGSLGNLGGYIVAAQLAGWLASVGVSVGGGAVIVSFLASIGGPITVGIAIALAVGAAILAIFGDSWEKRLAKKTIEAFKHKDVQGKLREGISQFWDDTENAFQRGAEKVEKDFKDRLAEIEKNIAESKSKDEFENLIKRYEEVRSFLSCTPWVPLA